MRSERGCRWVVEVVVVVLFVVVAELPIVDDELVSVEGVEVVRPPVDVVVAVLGLALIEPVAFVDVSVPVVALGLGAIVPVVALGLGAIVPVVVAGLVDVPASVRPVAVDVEVLPVAPGLAEPVPPSDVPVADVPLEPVPLLPLPPAPCASATLPAMPMMQSAAVAKVDFAFMCVSF